MSMNWGDPGDGRTENLPAAIALGIVLPSLLAIYTIYNLVTGWAYCPRGGTAGMRFIPEWTDNAVIVGFWIALQTGAIVAMGSWFWFANRKSLEHLAGLGLLVACLLAGGGMLVAVVRVFL